MIIALEEHYFDRAWNEAADSPRHMPRPSSPFLTRMEDLAEHRIREMDAAGIDVQVLSHAPPGAQGVRAGAAVAWSRAANDRLAAAIEACPARFAGLASVPTADPRAGADELERAVTKLGFKGAMIHSLSAGPFLDDKQYWPIFERAQAIDVPLYLHPADPHPSIIETYYKGYEQTHPMFLRAAWASLSKQGRKPCGSSSVVCVTRFHG